MEPAWIVNSMAAVRDWSFLIPAGAWAARESYSAGRLRGTRNEAWGMDRKTPTRLFTIGPKTQNSELLDSVAAVRESRAIQLVLDEARHLGVLVELAEVETPGTDMSSYNIIVVGSVGRAAPPLVRSMLPEVISLDRGVSAWGTELLSQLRMEKGQVAIVRDHGLIVKSRSPYNRERTSLSLIGRFPGGVLGAANVLARRPREVREIVKAHDEWAVAVSSDEAGAVSLRVVWRQ